MTRKNGKGIELALETAGELPGLRANNGSPAWTTECPVLGVEQKSISGDRMSVPSQEETFKPLFISIDSSIHGR